MIYVLYRREKNIVVTLNIYGARSIFSYFVITKKLKFSNTKLKTMYLDKYSPIKISKFLCDKNIHFLQHVIQILRSFFIIMELEPFSYKMWSLIHRFGSIWNRIWCILTNIHQGKKARLYDTIISVDNIVVIIHIYGARAIFRLFFVHQETELE